MGFHFTHSIVLSMPVCELHIPNIDDSLPLAFIHELHVNLVNDFIFLFFVIKLVLIEPRHFF